MNEVTQPEDQSGATAEVKADAKDRAKRSFKQGLIVAVVLGAVTIGLQIIGNWTHNEFMSGASWMVLGTSLIQAGAVAGLSYIKRFTSPPAEITPTEPVG